MKKIYTWLLALSAFAAISSCNKKDSDPPGSYAVNGVHDISMYTGTSYDLPVEFLFLSGSQGPVDISVTGLPTGVTASFSVASGVPTFQTIIHFQAGNTVAAGTYPIKIVGTSSVMSSKTIDAKLIIIGDCSTALYGVYNCTAPGINYMDTVISSGTVSKIIFKNFGDSGNPFFGDVNCSNSTINVPAQTIDFGSGITGTVSATGSFSGNTILINYHVTAPVIGTDSGTFQMVK